MGMRLCSIERMSKNEVFAVMGYRAQAIPCFSPIKLDP